MTTVATTAPPSPATMHRGSAVADALTLTWRNVLNIRRNPQLLVFSTIQPVLFILMFRYVFGNAIRLPDPTFPYVDYLMPGIFAQTVAFGAIGTGIGLAEDMAKGLVERFRSLPMARSAVLVGRSLADLARNVFVQILMVLVGVLVGFRIHDGFLNLVYAILILLVFGFALSWLFALIGIATRNAETTQAAAFPLVAPLVFASSAFVAVDTLPTWLQGFARNQPVSVTIAAVRKLILGPELSAKIGLTESTSSLVIKSLLWSIGIVAVFAPIAVARYRRG